MWWYPVVWVRRVVHTLVGTRGTGPGVPKTHCFAVLALFGPKITVFWLFWHCLALKSLFLAVFGTKTLVFGSICD